MGKRKEVEKKIKKILKEDTRGLSIQELANKTKVSRITVSMALIKLEGEKFIEGRNIGNCKLHYLKKGVRV